MRSDFLRMGFMLLITLFLPCTLLAEEETASAEATEKTILMDESLIVGVELGVIGGNQKRIPGPALSTVLRWDGVTVDTLDIPREILEHLSQPDLSFFKNREIADDLSDDMRSYHDE